MADAPGCYQILDFCSVRASLLNADGSLDQGQADQSAQDNSPISLGRAAIVSSGERIERRNGCGQICSVKEDADTTTGETLTLRLCNLNIEMIEVLTGATVILDPGDPNLIIGFQAPDPSANKPVVEFHGWTKTWNSDAQVADPHSYTRWVWPRTEWNIADWTLERGFLDVVLTGKASGNDNIGSGSFNDLPTPITEFFGVFFDEAANVPDDCGYLDTPAAAS